MRRIPVVEVLRGLASVSVALFHFCGQLNSTAAQWITSFGWLGVDVFFVISGFVIPLSLYGSGYTVRDFRSFLLRRLVRLEPSYLISVLMVIVLWHLSTLAPGFAGETPSYSYPQIALHLFYLIPLTTYSWLSPVYWTLAYEFVFYIIVGLTFSYLIKRDSILMVGLAWSLVALSFALYGTVDVRILEFLVGTSVMRLVVGKRADWHMGAWLITSLIAVYAFGGIPTTIAVVSAVCAILFFRSVELSRGLIFLGTISYSLYLVHVPIGGRVVNLAKRFGGGTLYEVLTVVVALGVSIFVAMLLHRLIEAPSIAASRKLGGG